MQAVTVTILPHNCGRIHTLVSNLHTVEETETLLKESRERRENGGPDPEAQLDEHLAEASRAARSDSGGLTGSLGRLLSSFFGQMPSVREEPTSEPSPDSNGLFEVKLPGVTVIGMRSLDDMPAALREILGLDEIPSEPTTAATTTPTATASHTETSSASVGGAVATATAEPTATPTASA